MQGCLVCNSFRECTQCSQGYELNNGVCEGEGGLSIVVIALIAVGGVIFLVVVGNSKEM